VKTAVSLLLVALVSLSLSFCQAAKPAGKAEAKAPQQAGNQPEKAQEQAAVPPFANDDIPVIDSHLHPISEIEQMPEFLKGMQDTRIKAVNLVCIPGREKGTLLNLVALCCKAELPKRAYVFGGLLYDVPGGSAEEMDPAFQARQLWEAGCDGIKMIETKPTSWKRMKHRVDSEFYEKYFQFLEEKQMPLVWHVADPWTYWQNPPPAYVKTGYGSGDFPPADQIYGEVDHVMTRHPRLKVIFAHMYNMCFDIDRFTRFMERWPNVNVDLAPGSTQYVDMSKNPRAWREFFIRFQDRICFGTDNGPVTDPDVKEFRIQRRFLNTNDEFTGMRSDQVFRGLGLARPVLEKIYQKNFERIAGATPRPINAAGVKRLSEQMRKYVEASTARAELEAQLKKIDAILIH